MPEAAYDKTANESGQEDGIERRFLDGPARVDMEVRNHYAQDTGGKLFSPTAVDAEIIGASVEGLEERMVLPILGSQFKTPAIHSQYHSISSGETYPQGISWR